ncbi:DUF1338 domain-containing protein [bacterium]|nr:DUF1338 domain-containing protein [bacterium]
MNDAEVTKVLWEHLWRRYRQRVAYAREYQAMIEAAGGRVVHDHVAFRSFRHFVNGLDLGIGYVARVLEPLGYQVKGAYEFPDTHLYAQHYEHPEEDAHDLPKVFVSELLVEELPFPVASMIKRVLDEAVDRLPSPSLEWVKLREERRLSLPDDKLAAAVADVARFSTERPWPPPPREVVETVNYTSQYAAWTLLHAFAVNHFTAFINRQNAAAYPDLESTVAGLVARGVPVRERIDGQPGSRLRQTTTAAVEEEVAVYDADGKLTTIPWTYAYYELAERGLVEGRMFHGFIANQARQLFETTRRGGA